MSQDVRPDFFIVGAPKCGTTALHAYLSEHPQVFMPRAKEPHFFATDLHYYSWYRDAEAYRNLFAPARSEHLAVGEASVWYLYSECAAARIRDFNPQARLIVMLRAPIQMFRSLHLQMLDIGWEDQVDPEQAWHAQEDRAAERSLPVLCDDAKFLQYGAICSLGEQVERLFSVFPNDQVRVILFDDFSRDTRRVYQETLVFLGLTDDMREDFPLFNVAHGPRWPRVMRLHRRLNRALFRSPAHRLAMTLLAPLRPASRWLRRANVALAAKAPLRPEFERHLQAFFAHDIDRLSALIQRDLSHWKAPDYTSSGSSSESRDLSQADNLRRPTQIGP